MEFWSVGRRVGTCTLCIVYKQTVILTNPIVHANVGVQVLKSGEVVCMQVSGTQQVCVW